ncbi:MAG: 5'-methylthioadenosine/adenosylhomocysteine nucleosidase, partial [Clostridia bacterium]|nr:5'-methylthioadenosine/adenosylhomocysteine nucleosidase [Clostridia bacterium]
CEMEGGAIAVVSFINKIPFAIVRAISDGADGESPENFSGFLEQAAGNSIRVIMRVVEEL